MGADVPTFLNSTGLSSCTCRSGSYRDLHLRRCSGCNPNVIFHMETVLSFTTKLDHMGVRYRTWAPSSASS